MESLQVEFNEASGLVQQKERELREARQAAEQKAKQLDVARYDILSPMLSTGRLVTATWPLRQVCNVVIGQWEVHLSRVQGFK